MRTEQQLDVSTRRARSAASSDTARQLLVGYLVRLLGSGQCLVSIGSSVLKKNIRENITIRIDSDFLD